MSKKASKKSEHSKPKKDPQMDAVFDGLRDCMVRLRQLHAEGVIGSYFAASWSSDGGISIHCPSPIKD